MKYSHRLWEQMVEGLKVLRHQTQAKCFAGFSACRCCAEFRVCPVLSWVLSIARCTADTVLSIAGAVLRIAGAVLGVSSSATCTRGCEHSGQACPWVAGASEGSQHHHTMRQMLEPQPLYVATWKTYQRARSGSVRWALGTGEAWAVEETEPAD